MPRVPSSLARLARLHGVQTAYVDVTGRRRSAEPQALLGVLRALGVNINSPAGAAELLEESTRRLNDRGIEPVVTVWNGRPAVVPLRLSHQNHVGSARVTIELEDGGQQSADVRLSRLLERQPDRHEAGRAARIVKEIPLTARLPFGYHRLIFETGHLRFESALISAPRRAWEPSPGGQTASVGHAGHPGDVLETVHRQARRWGVFLPLYSVRSGLNWGAGDYSDLSRLAEWTSGQGGSFVATLPLLPAPLDDPYDPSPYAPVTRLAWNELYIDVTTIEELAACDAARELLGSQAVQDKIDALRRAVLVEYRRLMSLKRQVLEVLAEWFFRARPSSFDRLEQFLQQHPQIVDYAEFRATGEMRHAAWTAWPDRLRDGTLRTGDFDEAVRRYYIFAQWIAHRQIERVRSASAARGTELYLDLPLGVRQDGYDVWRYRDCYADTVTAGAPPDAVFTRGQDWGFAPLDPQGIRCNAYRHVRAFLGHHLRQTGMLRIDHVMSLHRLYWIPRGMCADRGVYVRYPADELYAVLSLESHRHRAVIIGENLGTVPAVVNRAMSRHGIRQMHVVQYECESGDNSAPLPPPRASAASLNTHDMPTFTAWWRGDDIPRREQLGLLDADGAAAERQSRERQKAALVADLQQAGRLLEVVEGRASRVEDGPGTRVQGPGPEADAELFPSSGPGPWIPDLGPVIGEAALIRACLEQLAASPAEVVLVSLEDLWQETSPQNIPGTGQELPNWSRKARHALEDFDSLTQAVATLVSVARLRRAGR